MAQNSSDNFPFYHPDNHHSSDDVYWTEGESKRKAWLSHNQENKIRR